MKMPLAVLFIEDVEEDAVLMAHELKRGGFIPKWQRVQNREQLQDALANHKWDVVISDFSMPSFNAIDALRLVKVFDDQLPFIIVSGVMDEDTATAAINSGANNFFMKSSIGRLPAAVERELREVAARRKQRAGAAALRDMQERNRKELERAFERQKMLSSLVIDVQERERQYLARSLHEEVGQSLGALKMKLESIQKAGAGAADAGALQGGIDIVAGILAQVRSLSDDLRPLQLDHLGLTASLRAYVDSKAGQAGLQIHFAGGELLDKVHPDVENAGFRILQEAVKNCVQHAQANNIWVQLEVQHASGAQQLSLQIRDDGIGFDTATARADASAGMNFGLLNMEQRAMLVGGSFSILSLPGRGATISVVLPLVPTVLRN